MGVFFVLSGVRPKNEGEKVMKKILFAILISIFFVLCACAGNDESIESVAESKEEVTESTESSAAAIARPEDSEDTKNESSNVLSHSPYPENSAPTEDIEAIPILFLDTTDHRNTQAYIICAVNDNGLHTTHEFVYNEKHLLDLIDEQGISVETNIIDTSKAVTFYDKNGESFEASCGKIQCYGEEIIGEVHVCAEIDGNIPTESNRFIGVYDGVDIFPETLKYSDNSVTVDLDCDGADEVISWSFIKAEDYREGEGDYYYYSLEAIIDGKTVEISDNYDWTPLKKSDYEIFIADIDMDGDFEIVEYLKVANTYNNVNIYDVSADGSEPLHLYTITPEP